MTSFPVVLVAWQRDRDILVQRHEFAYNHVTKFNISGRGRSKSTSLCFGGDFCSNRIFALETETSRFLGNYQLHANETAIYVVSGVCLFRIT